MMTKAEAKLIDDLLTQLVSEVAMHRLADDAARIVSQVKRARAAVERGTEGRLLPLQLRRARKAELLPQCFHGKPLMDWSGEQLVPPCGCRLVERTDG